MRSPSPLLLLVAAALGCGSGSAPSSGAGQASTAGGDVASHDGGVDDGWGDDGWGDDGWGDDAGAGGGTSAVSAIAAIGVSGPETPWAQMSEYDREMYMVGKVLPIMADLFVRQDPARFGSYDCDTCHGEEMRQVDFHMPPASAFSVPAPGTPAWGAMERTSGDMVRFMREVVTPTMGTLLGVEGFTCNGCHPAR